MRTDWNGSVVRELVKTAALTFQVVVKVSTAVFYISFQVRLLRHGGRQIFQKRFVFVLMLLIRLPEVNNSNR